MSSSLSPSSSSASVSRTLTHHVFLSFRGADVRKNLLTHILGEFQRKGITPFIDNKMERGVSLGPELLRAIKAARITIVIFSKNYSSSSWCLDELVEIMKCKDELNQKVMTIFHQVKPTDVRHQGGDFGKAFEETCAGKSEEVKQLWKKTLTDAANIQGDGVESDKWSSEADMIAAVAIDVLSELQSTQSIDFDDYVGLPAHIETIYSLLCLDTYEVRMIGIWGPSGIGKTTISRVLLNKLSPQFQLSAHIGDIKRRHLRHHNLYEVKAKLQKELFTELLKHENIEIPHLQVAKERFHDKKVLVILDDVNELWQLQATVHYPQWFGGGSRIIITTQDRRVLEQHGIKDIYKVDYPSIDEAIQILCKYAFDQNNPHPGFEDLAKEVTEHVGKLPLALEVMGSHFKQMSREEWETDFKYFKKTRVHEDISDILKFSYKALRVEEKKLFDDIACFFNGGTLYSTEEIIGDDFHRNLRVLEKKSLIHKYGGKIGMHTLLAKLVRKDLEGCTVLVDGQKICHALAYKTDNSAIRGISLNLSEITHEQDIHEEAFEGMPNLEYLQIYNGYFAKPKLHLPRGLKSLPNTVKLLHWDNSPMKSMPFKFRPNSLVKTEMSFSKLEKLWEGHPALGSLKEIYLWGSKNLKELPNLSNATSLKRLGLGYCESLVEIPSSIGNATNLEHLNLSECSNLKVLPTNINLESLSLLNLSGCKRLKTFPEILTSIVYLNLSNTAIEEVPSSIKNLSCLTALTIKNGNIEILPTNFNLESLFKLDLSGCKRLKTFPEISTSLKFLNLSGTAIEEVPSSIWSWSHLGELVLNDCKSLKVFHPAPASIDDCNKPFLRLSILYLNGCTNLESLPQLPDSLSFLEAANCISLKRIQGSFHKPGLHLDFSNCSIVSQEAGELIEISDFKDMILPGKEVPAYFEHQAKGDFLTVKLDQRFKMKSKKQGPFPLFLEIKTCLLLPECHFRNMGISYHVLCIQNDHVIGFGLRAYYARLINYDAPEVELLTEHLCSFQLTISIDIPEIDVNHIELEFQFSANPDLEIQQCGVHLEHLGVYDDHEDAEYADIMIERNLHTETKRRSCKVRLSDSRDSQMYDEEDIRQHKRQKK